MLYCQNICSHVWHHPNLTYWCDDMTKKLTLVAIVAHPDDEAFGTGGTLTKYANEGVDVHLAGGVESFGVHDAAHGEGCDTETVFAHGDDVEVVEDAEFDFFDASGEGGAGGAEGVVLDAVDLAGVVHEVNVSGEAGADRFRSIGRRRSASREHCDHIRPDRFPR